MSGDNKVIVLFIFGFMIPDDKEDRFFVIPFRR